MTMVLMPLSKLRGKCVNTATDLRNPDFSGFFAFYKNTLRTSHKPTKNAPKEPKTERNI